MNAQMMGAEYEFSAEAEQVIDQTARRTKTWGVISIIVGALQLLNVFNVFTGNWLALVQGVGGLVSIIVGVVFLGAARSLAAVVTSEGSDVSLMLSALTDLGKAFNIQSIMAVLAMIAGFVIGIAIAAQAM